MATTARTAHRIAARLARLEDLHDATSDEYYDTKAQCRAEIAHYGDSWPGSAGELRDLWDEMTEVGRSVAVLRDWVYVNKVGRQAEAAAELRVEFDMDLPF